MAKAKQAKRYVIIRGDRSGVHVGALKRRVGREVVLTNSRRVWWWSGAASLSQMAMSGVGSDSRVTVEVPTITILDAIEIIPCSAAAEANLRRIAPWKI